VLDLSIFDLFLYIARLFLNLTIPPAKTAAFDSFPDMSEYPAKACIPPDSNTRMVPR